MGAEQEIIEWIRERPQLREVMLAFPPGCWVTEKEPGTLYIPGAKTCQVSGYFETNERLDYPIGVYVTDLDKNMQAECDPADLELVHLIEGHPFTVDAAFVEAALVG